MARFILTTVLFVLSAAAQANEKPLFVPSDTSARYTVMQVGGQWPHRTITTKRVGSSGTSYSKRLYNCASHTVKYLGSGETLAAMAKSKPDPRMTPIIPGAIADYVGRRACQR